MIPKTIHYCWFGKGKKSDLGIKCIESWKRNLPDYAIKEWNEENFDIRSCRFVHEAYKAKKFAFVADYARLFALYVEGGIYLDTDVEVLKSFDSLLHLNGFIGFEENHQIATAAIGAKAKEKWVRDVLSYYENASFIKWNGKLNDTPNPIIFEKYFVPRGVVLNGEEQHYDDLSFFPIDYFCGMQLGRNLICISDNTYCRHHFEGSWVIKSRIAKAISIPMNILTKLSMAYKG